MLKTAAVALKIETEPVWDHCPMQAWRIVLEHMWIG